MTPRFLVSDANAGGTSIESIEDLVYYTPSPESSFVASSSTMSHTSEEMDHIMQYSTLPHGTAEDEEYQEYEEYEEYEE